MKYLCVSWEVQAAGYHHWDLHGDSWTSFNVGVESVARAAQLWCGKDVQPCLGIVIPKPAGTFF